MDGFKDDVTVVVVFTVVVNATELSVLVEALFVLPATSVAPPSSTEATTFPAVVIPLTATLNVVGPPVTVATRVPPAVLPAKETLAAGKVPAGSLNTTVKLIGPAVAGSL